MVNHPNRAPQDHPQLRKGELCVLCTKRKDAGPLVCWECYRKHEMRYGNEKVERILDACEGDLATNEGAA